MSLLCLLSSSLNPLEREDGSTGGHLANEGCPEVDCGDLNIHLLPRPLSWGGGGGGGGGKGPILTRAGKKGGGWGTQPRAVELGVGGGWEEGGEGKSTDPGPWTKKQ